jgi:hypothetical protein
MSTGKSRSLSIPRYPEDSRAHGKSEVAWGPRTHGLRARRPNHRRRWRGGWAAGGRSGSPSSVLPVGRQKAEKPRRSSPPPPLAAAERRGDGPRCAPRGPAAPRARRRRICLPPRRSPASNRERSRRGRAPTSQGSTSTSPDPARRAQGSTSTASVRETGEGGVGGERAPGQGEEGPASPSCSLWE